MRPVRIDFWQLSLVRIDPMVRALSFPDHTGWVEDRPEEIRLGLSVLLAEGSAPDLRVTDSQGEAALTGWRILGDRPMAGRRLFETELGLRWTPFRTLRVSGRAEPGAAFGDWALVRPDMLFPGFIPETVQRLAPGLGWPGFGTLVETGTLFAHSAAFLGGLFPRVCSIELSAELHRRAQALRGLPPGLELLHGDSAEVLPALLPGIDGPAVFFLDAHWSGPRGGGEGFKGYPIDTAHRGAPDAPPGPEAQLPLREEIAAILSGFPHAAIVIVDDWPALGTAGTGWATQDWTCLDGAEVVAMVAQSGRLVEHAPVDARREAFSLAPL